MLRNLVLLVLFWPLVVIAAEKVDGSFSASQQCPAYVSKNKKTNPDNLYVMPGNEYALVEINRSNHPDWYRITIDTELRWVSASCGTAEYGQSGGKICDKSPGNADSYVLALSWQPGFCETYGYDVGKPECLNLPVDSYQFNHLVLHGLWPNQKACGINYGFCQSKQKTHHCDYAALALSPQADQQLKQFMPGYAAGSCIERHEWNKHGTCQLRSQDDYFTVATSFVAQFNQLSVAKFLATNQGKAISLNSLYEKIDESLGSGARNKVYLGCKNGILVDFELSLPAEFEQGQKLQVLMEQAPEMTWRGKCGKEVVISNFNTQSE